MLGLALVPAVVLGLSSSTCSNNRESCFTSRCCKHSSHGCFKMQRSDIAVCMPYAELGQTKDSCVDTLADQSDPSSNGWVCPGWDLCAAEYADCSDSKCCSNAGFGCYKKAGTAYAECRPQPKVNDTCVDTTIAGAKAAPGAWLCPAWSECAARDGDCSESRCCSSKYQACFKRPYEQEAQCRQAPKESEDSTQPWSKCRDTDEWLCPGWETCDNPDSACTSSGCCNHVGFTCYAVTAHFSQCMRTGQCEAQVAANPQWQQVSGVTCAVAGDDPGDNWEYVERRGSGDSRLERYGRDDTPAPPPPPLSTLVSSTANDLMLEQIRSELAAIRAAEAARQQAMANRQGQKNTVELIVGGLLIVTIIFGLAAFVAIWTKLSSRNLLMMLKSNTRYSNMEMGKVSSPVSTPKGNVELPAFPEIQRKDDPQADARVTTTSSHDETTPGGLTGIERGGA